MKSSSLHRGARFAFLILASAASSAPMLAFGAPADSTEVTAPQMIDAFEGDFGVHPGQRRNHTKGTCAAGEFVGTSDAAALSRSALFSGKTVPVVARFSLGGGNPEEPDAGPAPRGMALEFRLPGGALQHITMLDAPIFATASPASFRDLLLAAKPDPKTGQPDPEKLKAYAATHPDAMAGTELASHHTPTANYYQATYFSIHTFKFIDAKSTEHLVRWRFVPRDGTKEMTSSRRILSSALARARRCGTWSSTSASPATRRTTPRWPGRRAASISPLAPSLSPRRRRNKRARPVSRSTSTP
jgi:catalase